MITKYTPDFLKILTECRSVSKSFCITIMKILPLVLYNWDYTIWVYLFKLDLIPINIDSDLVILCEWESLELLLELDCTAKSSGEI